MSDNKQHHDSFLSHPNGSSNTARTWCKKHPTCTYDPGRYSGCYLCYIKERGLVRCEYCDYGYHKPEYDRCFRCFKSMSEQISGNEAMAET